MSERLITVHGRFLEDFQPGATHRHRGGRTLTQGEAALFTTWTMNAAPLHLNRLYAQSLGHPTTPVHPLLVLNVVFGMSVEDLSEQALAHLGYANVRFEKPVYPGDTLFAESTVLAVRPSGSRDDRGVVHVRTEGFHQEGDRVLSYERQILVKRRSHFPPGSRPPGLPALPGER